MIQRENAAIQTNRMAAFSRYYFCTPDGIRTHATGVRGRRPRPLDDGGLLVRPGITYQTAAIHSQLGYQDSNLD